MRWISTFWVGTAMLGIACQPFVVDPSLDGVSPNWGFNGAETPIEIIGTHLFPGVDIKGAVVDGFDRDFVARMTGLEDVTLTGVRLNAEGGLSAAVPKGLLPGWYDLEVQTPSGKSTELQEAFEVTDTRADHLRLTVDNNTQRVEQISIVRVSVRDPSGRIVEEVTPVSIDVSTSGDSEKAWSLEGGDLRNAQFADDGTIFVGEIGPTGEAFFAFTAHEPGDFWVNVEATIRDRVTLEGSELIHVMAGEVDHLQITPLDSRPVRIAGDPFDVSLQLVDIAGNTVSGIVATVVLTELCSGGVFQWIETFVDDALVTVTPTKACELNGIQGFGVVEGVSIEGQSESFTVRGGALSSLDVQVSPSTVQAGNDGLHLWVQGQDDWGNLVSDELTELRLSDAAGELEETSGNGSFACASAGAGVASCSAGLFRAAEGVILEARSNGAVYGWGNAIRVLPGPVSGLEVTLGTPTVVAGETLSLSVSAFDSFGNRQALLDEDLNGLNFYDEYGDIECRLEDTDGTEHVYTFLCSLYTAGSDNAVSVIASTLGASGIAGPLDVISGPIRNLSMNLDETVITGGITAGEPYVVTIEGRDTFGNLGDGITRVGLADVGGSIEPSSMIIEDGTGVATIVSTVAIEGNSIWGSVDELLAGGTEVFDVLHGDAVDMAASLPVMWAYTGEPLLVEVAVVDAFGNPASGEMHNVTIETGSALMVDVPVQGTRLVELSFPTAGLKDPIVAYTPDWIAETSTFLVGNLCEPAPLTSIDLRGIEDNRLCMGVDGSAHSDAIPIGSPSIHWLLLVDDDVVASGTPSSVSMDWVGRGRRHIESFTLGADLCGWEEEADVFVGGEREITGPVFISGSTDTLTAGDPGGAGVAEIWIQGRTCTGDLASDSIVYLQPMLGRVGSLDEDPLSDTLGGTTIVLESDGEAHFRWTMEDADQGEYGDLLVGTASGSALGQHHIDVIGDAAPPTIWEVDPHGSSEGLAESITIRFSEPMLDPGSASARTALVQLYDPDGSSVALGESTWMSDRSTLYIGLTAPIDTGSGVWELVVQDDFRDLAGNRIDGDWDGISGGEWSTAFGAVPDLDSMMSSCALTTGWFRPDGSDGPGLDAEEVHISGTTSAPSSWWRLDVFSADGTHWYRDETPRSGLSSGLMTWYGRGQTGRVVPNDTYQLELVALDDFRNAGESCVASVVVDNALEP